MSATDRAKSKECPSCQAPVPIHSGYVDWCDMCGWNLKPVASESIGSDNWIARWYRKIVKQQTEALYKLLAADPLPRPRRSAATVGALVFVGVIHSMTLVIAVLGLALIIVPWPQLLTIGIGVLLLAFAWSLCPVSHACRRTPSRARTFPPRMSSPMRWRMASVRHE